MRGGASRFERTVSAVSRVVGTRTSLRDSLLLVSLLLLPPVPSMLLTMLRVSLAGSGPVGWYRSGFEGFGSQKDEAVGRA